VGGRRSSKELFEQRINSYSGHLHMSPRQYNFLRLPDEVMAEVEEHGTVWVNGAVVEHGQGEVL
jgi:hypothetical protein